MHNALAKVASRREFLIGLVAGGSMLRLARKIEAGQANQTTNLVEARERAAKRPRRIVFNNDGDDIWTAGADTTEKFLAVRHLPLLNTQVDTICYCTTQSFNRFTHDTRVAETFLTKSGNFSGNNLPSFLSQKTDGLRMSSEFARRHGLDSIWSLRMNDIHDAWTPEFVSNWKQENPTRVMSTLEQSKSFEDRRRLWSLVDFEHPDVEPRLSEIVHEVLQHYDIDGVELDFLRTPIYFRTAFEGQPVTDAQRGVLTRLVRRIRTLVLAESERRRKPLLLWARVPVSPASCRRIGIDMETWFQEKLVDVLSLGAGYIAFDAPVRQLIDLAHGHGIPVYPCISQSGLMNRPPRGTSTNQPPEAWFGSAARLWADGADGIYTFNLFPGPGTDADRSYAQRVLSTIGSPETLHSKTIQYARSDAGWWMPSHFWVKDAEEFADALPLPLAPNDFTQTYLVVPEDLRGADISVTAELRVDLVGLSKDSRPTILFGSANFGPQQSGSEVAGVRRYICQVPLQAISQGKNRVMLKVAEENAQLAGAELWIRREQA